nr:MAG TPA: Nuclease [Caudoviricetes sp.]
MREKEIENDLINKAKKRGGIALKFTSPGYDGVPDRLVLLPNSKMGFVEVKAPGKKPRALQIARMQMLRSLGFKAYVLDDKKDTEVILNEIQSP